MIMFRILYDSRERRRAEVVEYSIARARKLSDDQRVPQFSLRRRRQSP
jgi:hypothetical protein